MERRLAMEAFTDDDAMERGTSPSSRSSSGCQSGWTLYLDHSNNNGARYVVPAYGDPAAAPTWMLLQQADDVDRDEEEEEDSMASDASSGPRPRQGDVDEVRRDFGLLPRHDERRQSYSTTGAQSSGCFGDSSTRSRSSSQGGGVARTTAAAIFRGDEATSTCQYRREVIVIDDDGDDELDDTASSSAVFSCPMPILHAR